MAVKSNSPNVKFSIMAIIKEMYKWDGLKVVFTNQGVCVFDKSNSQDDLRNVKDDAFSASISKVICDNHQVHVSEKLISKDGAGNMKYDAIVAPMYEVASNSNENDGVQKCVSKEKDVEDSDKCDNTPISICGLEDGEESEEVCAVIEVESSEKSYIGSSITPMKRQIP
ncbi:unnamed protein product [Lactuca virosa]|uniref:Uncharacterized protein n=1 Tax=Lactuca virosa TaxID=75947 RepID=A0AAU9N950_9ASTR|nr:unnamed protein product [Lactuca virosa]